MTGRWPDNRVTALFGIDHPIVQGGMIHNSGGDLAAAVSGAGGLGLVGAGGMRPDEFAGEIRRARDLTDRPFGVNIPLLYDHARECLDIALADGVRTVVTSAGSPKRVAGRITGAGAVFVHVAASPSLAAKCEQAGCDAVVVEGFEAGGHNGREELTTMVLTPLCAEAVTIPVIAAGGIATGAQMAAALALGADGVQVGSRFAVTQESASHRAFKQAVVDGDDTRLVLKKHIPVRLLHNAFRDEVVAAENAGATREQLADLLGRGRARRGMRDGDLAGGELEIGQVAALIRDVPGAADVVARMLHEFDAALARMGGTA